MTKKWVKVSGSDIRLDYPTKRVDSPEGCTCEHPIHPHFHYEPDHAALPARILIPPTILEDHGDGTYTLWGYGLFGPVGTTGKLVTGVTVEPLKTKRDFAALANIETSIDRSLRSQGVMYGLYKHH